MKKIIIILLFSASLYSMQSDNHDASSLQGMFSALEEDSRLREFGRIERETKHLRKLFELEQRIINAHNEAERLIHVQNKARYEQEHDRMETERLIGSTSSWKADNKLRIALVKSLEIAETQQAKLERIREKAAGAIEAARAAAQENAAGQVQVARIWVEKPLEFIKKDPKLVVGVSAGLALAIYASKHGTALLADAVKHYYRNPTLAQETSLMTPYENMMAKITGTCKPSYSFDDLILESTVIARFKNLAEGIKVTAANKGYFTHTLFYGQPGTGKTLLAKTIADASGLPYIYISGSSLRKFSIAEALIKLDELFNFAKKSSQPIVIIVDECEELFKKRDLLQQQEDFVGLQLLNHILMHTGTETTNFVLIGLTNRPEIVDPAFSSRCSSIVEIKAPSLEQRKDLLSSYVKKWLIDKPQSKTSFISFLFRWNKQPQINIEMEEAIFDESMINALATRLDGFTGRDISQLILDIKITAFSSPNRIITQAIVEQVVSQKIEKKAIEAKLAAHSL